MNSNEEEESNLSDDLGAAYDAAEAQMDEGGVLEEPSITLELKDEESTDKPAVTEGEGDPGPSDEAGEGAAKQEANADGIQAGDKDTEAGSKDIPAPVSWKAATREHWKNLPKVVKEEIARREHDISVGMRRNSEAATRGSTYDNIMNKYQSVFAATGQSPFQVVDQVVQTAAMLQGGTPGHKAQVVADIISQYGVDITTLDGILSGQPAAENEGGGVPANVQAMIDQALAPYQQQMSANQQAQKRQQDQLVHTANNEVDSFRDDPKNEFYSDVREDMADLLDLAAKRGYKMSLKDAYSRACAAREDISDVVASRDVAAEFVKKKVASKSIAGVPGGSGAVAEGGSLRESIASAWENSGRV